MCSKVNFKPKGEEKMEIYVEGKKFEDYNEALAYENELKRKKAVSKSKDFLIGYLKHSFDNRTLKFRRIVNNDNTYYMLIVADTESLSNNYTNSAVELRFGSRYEFDSKYNLIERYKVYSTFDEDFDAVSSIEKFCDLMIDKKFFSVRNNTCYSGNLLIFAQSLDFFEPLIKEGIIKFQRSPYDEIFKSINNESIDLLELLGIR